MEERKCTEVWQKYERGKQFNMSLTPNYYDLCNTNVEFFCGNQWKGLSNSGAMASLPKPVFNIIKRIGSLFVASLTSSSTKVSYEPLANRSDVVFEYDGMDDVQDKAQQIIEDKEAVSAAEFATSEVANLFDKLGMDYKIREALMDGIQTGDYCAHFYWDANAKPFGGSYSAYRGEIKMELVDGVNVMFSNPNNRNVEDQNYIIVIGRDTVKNLKREYKMHHGGKDLGEDQIMPDTDYQYQLGDGGHTEMMMGEDDKSGKALFMYYYKKKTEKVALKNEDGTPKMIRKIGKDGKPIQKKLKDGYPMVDVEGNPIYEEEQAYDYKTTVWVSKHTKYVDIFEPVDTGLSYYPIAWGNWQQQKNCYHGRALVTEIIPNQIYINSMFALVMRHLQLQGFPKTLYDGNVIGQWSNEIGQAIAVYDLPPDRRMSDLHSVIQPADMSTQIMRCIEEAMTFTKECLGATDAQLGNVRPDNTSALIALQSSSQVPLENPQSEKYKWVEDIGRILLDMMATYYGERPVVKHKTITEEQIDPTTGMPTTVSKQSKVIEMYDFSKLKNLWLNVRADVGASTYWSKIAVVQTLDNLKQSGVLDVIDYLERLPSEYLPRKDELLAKLRKQVAVPQQPAQQMPQAPEESAPAAGVAAGQMPEENNAAVVASMPPNIQQAYENLGAWPQKALLQQTKLNTVGV